MKTHLMIATRTRRQTRTSRLAAFAVALCLATTLPGCTKPSVAPSETMADAVTARPAPPPAQPTAKGQPTAPAIAAPAQMQAIATVNGRTLSYSSWLDLMRRAHGLSAFQQILAVELARQAAEAKGIVLTEPQLETAFRQEIADVVGPETKDPAESERILRAILTRRGVSMDEFRLSAYRNAYLRRIAEPIVEAGISEDAMKVEFDRLYGPKVQIRHIQLSDSGAAGKVMEALEAGQDFGDLARKHSQSLDSAPTEDCSPRSVSWTPACPRRSARWHSAWRSARFPAPSAPPAGRKSSSWRNACRLSRSSMTRWRPMCGRSLKEQLVRQKTQELLRNMLQSASIQVYDEELGKQFQSLRQAKP